MNILFPNIHRINSIDARGIFTDLMRKFRDEGHNVFIVCPSERRFKEKTQLLKSDGVTILKVRTLNLQKTNVIEKGIGILLMEYQYFRAIKKHLKSVRFDLVLYSTPPITLISVIRSIKKRDNSLTYLLLKDIFPQNAVDLGMLRNNGLIHRYFRRKERIFYRESDYIGCMSPANVDYIISNNPWINPQKVEVNPNSIEVRDNIPSVQQKIEIRGKYNIPREKTIFIYGGNLGKPQGLDFLLETIAHCADISKAFFLIVGSGTEYHKLKRWFDSHKPTNALLINELKKSDYDTLLSSCNVGLILLDKRFTIPNFPSRLLSYLENRLPIIAATDSITDIGRIAEDNDFGFSLMSGDLTGMKGIVKKYCENSTLIDSKGQNGYKYLLSNYTTDYSYNKIISHFEHHV